MNTKAFLSFALVAALWSMPALADAPQRMLLLDFKAEVQADGTLANIQPDASLSPMLQELVSKRVAQWRYRPGTWQGRPVPGKVSQRITAEIVPAEADSFAFRVREVTDVPHVADPALSGAAPRMRPPSYPRQALRQGVEATLIYAMRRDAQGVPVEVELVDAQGPEHWRARFAAASLQAIQQWRLEPVEVDGKPIDCRLLLPMTFRVSPGTTPPPPTPAPDLWPYQSRFADTCPLAPVLETRAAGTHL